MIKFNKKCSTCKRIKLEASKGNSKLMDRLFNSRAYSKGGESLRSIARGYTGKVSFNNNEDTVYQSLYKHVKFHQAITEDQLIESRIARKAKAHDNEIIRKIVKHQDVRDTIMEKGLEQIEGGEIKLTAGTVLQAANKQADIELKEKDQNLKLMEMIAMFQSGELKRVTDEQSTD